MKLLFITDPLDSFKIYKDSSFAMMRAAQERGHTLAVCEPSQLRWRSGHLVDGLISTVRLSGNSGKWYEVDSVSRLPLKDFDAIVMRKDPPFDSEYFYATHLLEQAQREGAQVFNRPQALRDHPEKLAILEFPQFIAPTLVTCSAADIHAFHDEHKDIILKPLDGMGGLGIFRVTANGMNLGSIIETLSQNGARTLMVQKFIPAIAAGDKRVLLIDGEAVPYCLARIPQGQEIRGNLAVGGLGVAQALSPRDLEIAQSLGPVLQQRGLLLVGLDIIGENLTEINVTSPTCFQEITQQTGLDVAALFVQALERQVNGNSVPSSHPQTPATHPVPVQPMSHRS